MELSQDQMAAMPMEELQRHAQGLGPQATEQAAPAPQPEQPATPPAAGPPAPAAPPDTPQEQRGNPAEALRQEREARRQLAEQHQATAAQLASLQQALQDPSKVKAHLAAINPTAPDFDIDPEAAVRHYLAPLQQQLQATTSQLQAVTSELNNNKQQAAKQAYVSDLTARHGPDFQAHVDAFDANNPHQAHLDPELKFLAVKGYQAQQAAKDPAANAALVQTQAQKLAEAMVTKALVGGTAPKGIATLGAAPTGKESQQAPDLGSLGRDASLQDMQAALKAHYGGG